MSPELLQIEEPSTVKDALADPGLAIGLTLADRGLLVAIAVGGNLEVVPGEDGGAFLSPTIGYDADGDLVAGGLADGSRLTAEDLLVPQRADARGRIVSERLAVLLEAARRKLSQMAKRPVTRAVISAPMALGPGSHMALLQAVETAGMELLKIVETPIAVALAAGLDGKGDGRFLWLGRVGAELELAVLETQGGRVRILDDALVNDAEAARTFAVAQGPLAGLLTVEGDDKARLAAALGLPPVVMPDVATAEVTGAALMAEALA